MTDSASDNYQVYYADKLWNLLPAIYRTQDTDQFGANGPLRELVNRIGATAAPIKRSIDRLWEDQSIETCDDWVIPYIAALLDTQLVLGLDARGQRLDVANTIRYRRRKGTLAMLEQIASDISGWDAKAVEFFRRLGRTRHGLDPPIGARSGARTDTSRLQRAEGLIGTLTGTAIGGFADLRNPYGAASSRTAFDEFYHTADVRFAPGLFGWHAIPHLGIFVWRLQSFAAGPVTPVAVRDCPGWYTFDPTGRDIPLFAGARSASAFGDTWVSPSEGQLPAPISQTLLDRDIRLMSETPPAGVGLYPNALSVYQLSGAWPPDPLIVQPQPPLLLRPERGRFYAEACAEAPAVIARYHYGFPSTIGAGTYDRRDEAVPFEAADPAVVLCGGGSALQGPLPSSGTITLSDSLTYSGAADLTVTGALTVRGANRNRPLVRLDGIHPWIITSTSADARLTLDGLFVSGQDLILRGPFASVTIVCSSLDPGTAVMLGPYGAPLGSPPPALYASAADGRELRPTRVWIEGTITAVTVDRCVLGPIRTRGSGAVATLSVSNSTLQAIRTAELGPLSLEESKDPARFMRALQLGLDPVSKMLRERDPQIGALLGPIAAPPPATPPAPPSLHAAVLARVNELLLGPSLYNALDFARVRLSDVAHALLSSAVAGEPAPALNRALLEDAYPLELADAALAFGDGTVVLSRCTVMGRIVAHRFSASECIMQELALVDDLQEGCVRFTAWASGSRLPRRYECVEIAQDAPLFTSQSFGAPAYAQLLERVDAQIVPPATQGATPPRTISAGAADRSEMGAYARDRNSIRARALLVKLVQYMPANLLPVVINVT
jgi:hypothetical protein